MCYLRNAVSSYCNYKLYMQQQPRSRLMGPSQLVASRSGNALCRINEVALHQARLVLGYRQVKPSWSETSQLGRLSLLPSVGW